ncbi:MAG: cystathionine gamma-synthase [Nocardioidaceae bacterium]|nr:cystathionine gamma-synthase [Nocardioidaceae bacterium]
MTLAPATIAVAAGRPPRGPDGPTNSPIVMASTYHAGGEIGYGRYGNPTWEMFESAIGALEGGVATSYASGMAAVAAVLDLVPDGGTVVTSPEAYYGTIAMLEKLQSRSRLMVRQVDLTDSDAAAEALPSADLLWVESPTNPLLSLVDLPTLLAGAQAAGVTSVVDNTFNTPIVARPLDMGATVVVHSATKYLSGHSDLLMGVAVARHAALVERLVSYRSLQGAVPGAVEAWLALRGLRTLHLRMERAQASAAVLADRLGGHQRVDRVHYPGSGAMVSVVLNGDVAAAERVCGTTQLWVHATSLGGVESSLERRRRWPGESHDVPETLLRLSVGIEDVDDLWNDLAAALDA